MADPGASNAGSTVYINRADVGEGVKFTATKGLKPIPVAIAALSISLVPQIMIVMTSGKCGPILISLLAAVALSSIVMASIALEDLVATEIFIDHTTLKWNTLISSRTVDIRLVSQAEIGAVDGALSIPQLKQGPPPIGVWLTIASQGPKQPEERVLVITGPTTVASDLDWIIDTIRIYKLPAAAKQGISTARLAKAKKKPKREFRRPAKAPASGDGDVQIAS